MTPIWKDGVLAILRAARRGAVKDDRTPGESRVVLSLLRTALAAMQEGS